MDDSTLAAKAAEAFWQNDTGTRSMGIDILSVGPGTATAEMTLSGDHLNGHGTGHGGAIYFLAVTAFGYAANTHNQRGFGHQANITYLEPVHPGDTLQAVATELHRGHRSGIYDVEVRNQNDALVAILRGGARNSSETWIDV